MTKAIVVCYLLMLSQLQAQSPYRWEQRNSHSLQSGAIIWQDQNWQLKHSPQRLQSPETLLAVVKYPRASYAASLVEKFTHIVTQQPYDHDVDIAVLAIDQLDQLDLIAQAVHQEFHSCGMLQIIYPGFTVSTPKLISPPVFDTQVGLDAVNQLMTQADIDSIKATISSLSSLSTRHHSTGTVASEAVSQIFSKTTNQDPRFTIDTVSHTLTDQQSVIATLKGSSSEKVVIGAHLDSINVMGISAEAPGADDDASGIAILNEILRIITSQQLAFTRTIEIQAYAAEEVGLVGSQDIASKDTDVIAMMQIDMAMFGADGNDGHIHLVKDDTSINLRRHGIQLINNYIQGAYSTGNLPHGATSDHKSFYQQGIPTLFPFEDTTNYNKKIHTNLDTFDNLNNPDLAINITKLGLAFFSHYAGLSTAQEQYEGLIEQIYTGIDSDIFIAAQEASAGSYFLSISAPNDVKSVEFCQIEDTTAADCQDERLELTESITRQNRLIYYATTPKVIVHSQSFRIWAYDSSDQLIHKRDVTAVIN